MMRTLSGWAVLAVLLSACGTKSSGDAVADSFTAFYQRFHEDSLYQLQHIQFPLQGLSSDPANHHSDFRFEQDTWLMHRMNDPEKTGFSSEFIRISDELIIEKISNKEGSYGMERRWARLSDQEWHLIFYAELHPLGTDS